MSLSDKPSFLQSFLQLMGIMLLYFPIPLRLWIVTLMVINVGGMVMFPESLEVQVAFINMNASALFMTVLYQRFGFVKLLGVGHISWPILLVWIFFARLPNVQDKRLQMWLTVLVVMDDICVALDIVDVYKYLVKGQRDPTFVWDKDDKTSSKKQQ